MKITLETSEEDEPYLRLLNPLATTPDDRNKLPAPFLQVELKTPTREHDTANVMRQTTIMEFVKRDLPIYSVEGSLKTTLETSVVLSDLTSVFV